MTSYITTELTDHVFKIGLNRPEKRNAINLDMMRQLASAFGEFEECKDARVAVVFGHGGHFCAGLELDDCADTLMSPLSPGFIPEGGRDPWGVLTPRPSRPVVVAVTGACVTVGIEMCLASEVVVAAADAKFAQLEVSRGIFPFGGSTVRWPLASGYQNAMRYLLTSDFFTSDEAKHMGLVQDVVPADDVIEHAMSLAKRIAAQAPLGVKAVMRSARLAQDHGQAAAIDALYPQIRSIYPTADAALGIRTFLDRERPFFAGE